MKSALKVKVGNIPIICSRWTCLSHEGYSPFSQVDQSRHREGPIGVLSQAAITRPDEAPPYDKRIVHFSVYLKVS
jgi:hypothetical protein